MRTYPHPFRGWAGGLRLLAGLALLVVCAARAAAAQQRKYLVELSAAGAYQSFDAPPTWAARLAASARLRGVAAAQFSVEAGGRLRLAQDQYR